MYVFVDILYTFWGLCALWLTLRFFAIFLLFFTKYPVREYLCNLRYFFLHSSRSGNFFFQCLRIVYVVCAISFCCFNVYASFFPVDLITLFLRGNLLCFLLKFHAPYVTCLHKFFFCNHRVTAFFLGGIVRNLYIYFVPMGRIFVSTLIPLGISFLFSPLVVVMYTVAVSAQDYALFNLFVDFSEPPTLHQTVDISFFLAGIFMVEV